jgi:hypothetical protein
MKVELMSIRTDNITQAITVTDLNVNSPYIKKSYQIPKSYSFLQLKYSCFFLLIIHARYRKRNICPLKMVCGGNIMHRIDCV